MSHRVINEHRRLEDLFETLGAAFADDQPASGLWEPFEHLSEELQTHFEREDRLYFPAIWTLCPELKAELEEASSRHSWFCDQLRIIGDHLGHDDIEGATMVFRQLEKSFGAHEQVEEQILTRLDAALEA